MNEWIPVSERLPKQGEYVLAYFKKSDGVGKNIHIAKFGLHDVEDKYWNKIGEKQVWYTEQYHYDIDEVIAWMPLPEPYKGV